MAKKKDAPVYQLPSESKIKALLRVVAKAYKDIRGIAGEKGAAIANATEHDHLHKSAFATIERIKRMTPEKAAEWKAHFDDYWVKSGLDETVNSVERLPLGDDDDKERPQRQAAE